jgi:flagella basal body P-ring formation protein FlgA
MMRSLIICLFLSMGASVIAGAVVPARTIRAKEIISAQDLTVNSADIAGAYSQPQDVVGQEARVTLYVGRPIRPGDIGPPAVIGRNDIVSLVFVNGSLKIVTEGRALGRGAVGETIRAMNVGSRTAVTGVILANGSIEVQ